MGNQETLKARIENLPVDSVLFRSDFPEYHKSANSDVVKNLHHIKHGYLQMTQFLPKFP